MSTNEKSALKKFYESMFIDPTYRVKFRTLKSFYDFAEERGFHSGKVIVHTAPNWQRMYGPSNVRFF